MQLFKKFISLILFECITNFTF